MVLKNRDLVHVAERATGIIAPIMEDDDRCDERRPGGEGRVFLLRLNEIVI